MNRIEDIIATKIESEREAKEQALERLVMENPQEKKILYQEFKEGLDNVGKRIARIQQEVDIKVKLKEVTEIISLSYIAKNYFHKTRQWLYQRINENVVAGKKQKLTEDQLKTLDFALKDISKKIGSLSITG